MRVHILAVGRLRKGAQADLVADYIQRAGRSGRALGISSVTVTEVDERKGGSRAGEAALLEKALPQGASVIALDERGTELASPAFAARIAAWRDGGCQDLAFLIGGADGLEQSLVARADLALSFGKMVWPHMLARVMLSEQIYRAVSILAGSPYHRA